MDSESKKLLEDTYALVKDNNKILHYIRRSMRVQHLLSFVYWLFIVGSIAGTYYFIQPYIDKLVTTYSGAKSTIDSGASSLKNLSDTVNKLKKQYGQ